MNKNKISIITALLLASIAVCAQDSIKTVNLSEVSIVAPLKESGALRHQAASVASIDMGMLKKTGQNNLKGIGTLAPNLFMPDYGSRQTSAIYVRGIGSRIGTPAVGLYVDNVAYYDKSAFDFNLYDAESIEVLRGPQSTLYGRNAMGGIVRIKTLNPFTHQGTDIHLGYSAKNNRREVSATHYNLVSDRFAFSLVGFYDGNEGFYTNATTGKKADGMESGGGRARAIWKAGKRLTFDTNLSYEYSDEKAYPYFQYGDDEIKANLQSKYRRGLLNASINTEYKTDALTLNSVTAFQNINDRMFMDQDFSATDMYQLVQKQKINTLSEELILKNNGTSRWQWLMGANLFYQWQNVKGPVTFRKDGVSWLNKTINDNANSHMPSIQAGPMTMSFMFNDAIQGEALCFDNDFDTPTMGAALFHQSTFGDLLGIEGLTLSAGLRLDYEKMWMDYSAWYDFTHIYGLSGHLAGPMTRDIEMVPANDYDVSTSIAGKISQDYLQLLPKATLKYNIGTSNIYAAVSRGYRSGGYNVQNISEFMRKQMQADMMQDVCDATLPVLQNQPMVPADAKEQVSQILNAMAATPEADIKGTCAYKPEYAWNYEIGTHITALDGKLLLDLSGFVSDVRDLQLSQMSETGLGRIITNAGRSRSIGAELAVSAKPLENLVINASAGYVNAEFRDYSVYDDNEKMNTDCRGNRVPFIPEMTLNLNAAYTFRFDNALMQALTIGADMSAVSSVEWDELNQHSSGSYALLGANLKMSFSNFDVTLWGRNLTDKRYTTFWFETMKQGYSQYGKPLQIGINLDLKI